jgi:hypothetical protein
VRVKAATWKLHRWLETYECMSTLWFVVKFYPAVKTDELELNRLGIQQLGEKIRLEKKALELFT